MLREGKLILCAILILFHNKQLKNQYNLKAQFKINFMCN